MPQIAEIKEIEGEIWVRIGKMENHESGIAIWAPKERQDHARLHYNLGYEEAKDEQ